MIKNKMVCCFLIISIFCIFLTKVKAYDESDFSDMEQRYIFDMYGSYDFIDDVEYNHIKELNLDTNGYVHKNIVDTEQYNNFVLPNSVSISTAKKEMSFAATCGGLCKADILVKWKSDPNVKNYDVVGVRLSNNMELNGSPITRVITKSGESNFNSNTYLKYSEGGVGTTVKLPNNTTNYVIRFTTYYEGSGLIYASYQHCVTNNNSLKDSQKYVISAGGYGGVFKFDDNIARRYDAMNGLYIRS